MSNSIISIGDYAFLGCEYLENITIPNSVTNIGDYAFKDCRSLKNITIPNSVTSIGDYVFYGCSLYNITIGKIIAEKLPNLGIQNGSCKITIIEDSQTNNSTEKSDNNEPKIENTTQNNLTSVIKKCIIALNTEQIKLNEIIKEHNNNLNEVIKLIETLNGLN